MTELPEIDELGDLIADTMRVRQVNAICTHLLSIMHVEDDAHLDSCWRNLEYLENSGGSANVTDWLIVWHMSSMFESAAEGSKFRDLYINAYWLDQTVGYTCNLLYNYCNQEPCKKLKI